MSFESHKVEELHPDLAKCVGVSASGLIEMIQHPLVHTMYIAAFNAHVNAMYRQKKEKAAQKREAKQWGAYVFLHERPYRVDIFAEIAKELTDPEYWSILGHIWTDSENIHQSIELWRDLWSSPRPGKEASMKDGEQRALAALPNPFTVYRGVCHRGSLRGMSWTINRAKAVWFARRWSMFDGSAPLLGTAEVPKHFVHAHFLGRSEHEVVVDLPDFWPIKMTKIGKK